ncbi:MAG: T9SS type A sorting domain-containing protein [Chitinispirillaceae bacterium]|nr:T9SS type A sorting domain-containing protein [Chitinispirillaceae bacterium]
MATRMLAAFAIVVSIVVSGFSQTRTMQIAGVQRSYIVHAPSGLQNPPFVLNIHGYNMDAASEQSYTRMDQIADREKFIVVYPNAINKSWNMSGQDDFTFLMAIIDTIDNQYHIDRKRIYSCGFSQGGFMTFQLACRYSDVFAAIAPTSGNLTGNCSLKRPMSMRLTFGTDEGFEGGSAGFMANVTKWIAMIGCPEIPEVTRPYPPSNPNSVVTRLYYGPCDDGTVVIADSIRTGQHEWPMNTNDRINNSEETWAFLKQFSLPDETPVRKSVPSMMSVPVSATYNAGVIHLRGVEEVCPVRVIDTEGRLVVSASAQWNRISFTNKSSGVYFVQIERENGSVARRVLIP